VSHRNKNNKRKEAKSPSRSIEVTPLDQKVFKLIIVTILVALALILFLGLIDKAGPVGLMITHFLGKIFGWANWSLPVLLLISSYFLLKLQPAENLSKKKYFGFFFFIVSLSGILYLLFSADKGTNKIGESGGYVGYSLAYLFQQFFGYIGSMIVFFAIFIISLILLFVSFDKTKEKQELKEGKKENSDIKEEEKIPKRFGLISWWKSFQNELERKEKDYSAEAEARKILTSKTEEIISQDQNEKSPRGKKISEIFKSDKGDTIRKKITDLPFDLLDSGVGKPDAGDVQAKKFVIQKTLNNFGIEVEMGACQVGPTVTQYTLKPADGVKLSQITGLNNDIALALAAHPIRIEAPIPGQSLVGIEVPNRAIAIVRLRELLETEEFKKRKTNLTITLGRDVAGAVWLADLGRMPHLLIAGSTGSGKTVMLNSIIVSLLYENTPEDLKFIMIDPKRVELTFYNDLPHLLVPVVTEVPKTINALKWAIREMENRFDILSNAKKRDIETYNREMPEKMPYIVIVVDELADLMVTAPQDVETCIIRLAQMARAVGIHLVLATQRPSVDIITGLIKANITSRIAFSVASMVDSRTILDTSGAEKLLGRGDMLFTSSELSKPKRLQGAYVSDKEIKRVVEYLRNQREPDYNLEIIEKSNGAQEGGFSNLEEDELLSQAREVVVQAKKASASLLQRRLRVGYARAARLLDLLEQEGTIGPGDGAKPREVFVTNIEDADSDKL